VEFPIWSHEAAVTRAPSGEYVAFFSYNPSPGPSRTACHTCTDGSTPSTCSKSGQIGAPFIENTDPTYMSWSADARGNWSEPVLVLGPSVVRSMTPMDTNMAVVINSDGSVSGMWRDHHPTGKSTPHLVAATNWKEPNTYKFSEDDLLFGSKETAPAPTADTDAELQGGEGKKPKPHGKNPGGLEDMFLWVDKRGNYHAVFHQMYACDTCTAHAAHPCGDAGEILAVVLVLTVHPVLPEVVRHHQE